MTPLGWVGVWLLVAGVVAILAEGVVAAVWTLSLARRSRELSARVQTEVAQIQEDVERVRAALAEAERLWQPYGRVLGWLRHPLAIALLQSYARRRAM